MRVVSPLVDGACAVVALLSVAGDAVVPDALDVMSEEVDGVEAIVELSCAEADGVVTLSLL